VIRAFQSAVSVCGPTLLFGASLAFLVTLWLRAEQRNWDQHEASMRDRADLRRQVEAAAVERADLRGRVRAEHEAVMELLRTIEDQIAEPDEE